MKIHQLPSIHLEFIHMPEANMYEYVKSCSINFAHEFNTRDTDLAYEFFQQTMKTLIENDLQRKKNRRNKLFKNKPKGVMTDEYIAACLEFDELHKKIHSEYIERVHRHCFL